MELTRSRRFTVRFLEGEWRAVELQAEREDVTPSELVRRIVVRAVQRRAVRGNGR